MAKQIRKVINESDSKLFIADMKSIDFELMQLKKASGKQKLKDLGLDDDEIKALMGA